MVVKQKSVLLVGFNTRPLAYSLNKAGYEVYAVDFFGDLDLYPHVKDCLIVSKRLQTSYALLKEKYGKYLIEFAIEMLQKLKNINYILIGSGLDDAYEGRESILQEIKDAEILSINNSVQTIKKARDIEKIYEFLKSKGYIVPLSYSYDVFKSEKIALDYPFILKKKKSAGGTNVFKIKSEKMLKNKEKILEIEDSNQSDWLIQEYTKGIPASCTVISNGKKSEIISINRQIIGLDYLNPPKKFIYCGNVVPANLLKEDNDQIEEISLLLSKYLGLKGINGFDFVIKNHNAYLMEINPRIPGSFRATESVLGLNLLDLHIQSFFPDKWTNISNLLKSAIPSYYATKLVFFAPKEIEKNEIIEINNLNYVHDKTTPENKIYKDEPVCTVLYKAKKFSESFFGALKIIDEIYEIIS